MNKCSVCRSPRLDLVHAAIVAGSSVRAVARTYGLSKSAVERHVNNCAGELVRAARSEQAAERGSKLDADLAAIAAETRQVLEAAQASKDWGLALRAIARLETQLALRARIEGDIAADSVNASVSVDLAASPEWVELRALILRSLDGPSRLALAEALQKGGY